MKTLARIMLACTALWVPMGCSAIERYVFSGDKVVVSDNYDALWDATYAVMGRYGQILRSSPEAGFMETNPKQSSIRTSGMGHAMPTTVDVALHVQARFVPKRADGKVDTSGPVQVLVRVYEHRSRPHQVRVYRDGIQPSRPDPRQHVVNHGSTSTRSRVREEMLLDEITHELQNRLGAAD